MRRPAFTLIELLITAVLFVVVAGYAVSILGATIGLTNQARHNQGAVSQNRGTLEIIGKQYQRANNFGLPPKNALVYPSTDIDQPNVVLIIPKIRQADTNGVELVLTDRYDNIFCAMASDQNSAKRRLVRFTALNGIVNPIITTGTCSLVGVRALYSSGLVTGPEYLTDETTNVQRFEASVTQFSTSVELQTGLRLGLTTVYDPSVTNPGVDLRASELQQDPTLVRLLFTHTLVGDAVPFVGL